VGSLTRRNPNVRNNNFVLREATQDPPKHRASEPQVSSGAQEVRQMHIKLD
jgi:hypothetical protein